MFSPLCLLTHVGVISMSSHVDCCGVVQDCIMTDDHDSAPLGVETERTQEYILNLPQPVAAPGQWEVLLCKITNPTWNTHVHNNMEYN